MMAASTPTTTLPRLNSPVKPDSLKRPSTSRVKLTLSPSTLDSTVPVKASAPSVTVEVKEPVKVLEGEAKASESTVLLMPAPKPRRRHRRRSDKKVVVTEPTDNISINAAIDTDDSIVPAQEVVPEPTPTRQRSKRVRSSSVPSPRPKAPEPQTDDSDVLLAEIKGELRSERRAVKKDRLRELLLIAQQSVLEDLALENSERLERSVSPTSPRGPILVSPYTGRQPSPRSRSTAVLMGRVANRSPRLRTANVNVVGSNSAMHLLRELHPPAVAEDPQLISPFARLSPRLSPRLKARSIV